VGAARVDEGDEGRGPEGDGDLHGARQGNTRHCLKGETGRSSGGLGLGRVIPDVVDLNAIDEEETPAKPVMATGELFIAIEAKAQAAALGHLLRREAALWTVALPHASGRGGRW
jgi:hypothetical protein